MRTSAKRAAVIENRLVRLTLDRRGRLVSLVNKATGTELVTHPEVAEAWRLVIPTGRHTLAFVYGSNQAPPAMCVERTGADQSVVLHYGALRVAGRRVPIRADFRLALIGDTAEIRATVTIRNGGSHPIDEVEFPVLGGLGGFRTAAGGQEMQLIHIQPWCCTGAFHGDVLNGGLPVTGREADQYVREHETAMWEDSLVGRLGLDFYGQAEGLLASYLTSTPQDFAWKLERYPKGVPNEPRHDYPKGTPRWLRLWGVHLPLLKPGASWASEPVTLLLHGRGWHDGAEFHARRAFPDVDVVRPPRGVARVEVAEPPRWMDEFVGWTEIIGKLYTGEVFHDFATCARKVVADKKVTGLDLLFYYGHTNLGAEGADFDQAPARDMGGENGFARMLGDLHRNGVRVMLLDHFHRYVNRDVPEYGRRRLERWAVRGPDGRPMESRWWKETVLSCRRLSGPTPVWIEMCPACEAWQEYYRAHVHAMIDRGVDGLELDCFGVPPCHSRDHGHAPGHVAWPEKLAFLRQIRAEAKRKNPDFVFVLETMAQESRGMCDAWYNNRFTDENSRLYRYMFPGLWQQAVRVGNCACDAVNRSVMLGVGVETEIWGLRKTTLDAWPEFARYIGEVTRFRRRYGEILIRGTYRDTRGARVRGDGVCWSVLEGRTGGRALVLRQPDAVPVRVTASFEEVRPGPIRLWRPGVGETTVRRLPLAIELGPRGLAVLVQE